MTKSHNEIFKAIPNFEDFTVVPLLLGPFIAVIMLEHIKWTAAAHELVKQIT